MPRNKQNRKIKEPPRFLGYKPYGSKKLGEGTIELLFEEYEAIKLTDYNKMTHQEACRHMGISRPTFARIYEIAREKIARALVETREIKTTIGNAVFEDAWYFCNDCNQRFPWQEISRSDNCPTCRSDDLRPLA